MPCDECDNCYKDIKNSIQGLDKIIKDKDLISGNCKTCNK